MTTSSRRDFLSIAAASSTLAASGVLSGGILAASADTSQGGGRAHTEAQVLADVSSMQATIPPEFWAELKRQNLIEQNAPTPTIFDNRVQVIQGRGT